MISINATLFVQVIHFLLLTFILNRLLFQPIMKLIDERTGHIARTKEEIKQIEVKIEDLKQEFVSRQNDARKDAARQRSEIRGEGIVAAEEFLTVSRKEVSSIKTKATEEVVAEVNKTQPQLEDQAATLTDVITEKIIGRRIAV